MAGTNLRILARNIVDEPGVVLSAVPAFLAGLDEQVLLQPTQRGIYARTASGIGASGQRFNLNFAARGVQRVNMVVLSRMYDQGDVYSDYTINTTMYQAGSPSVALASSGDVPAFDFSQLHRTARVQDAYMRGWRNIVQYTDLQTNVESADLVVKNGAISADRYTEFTRLMMGEYFECEYDPPFGGAKLTYMGGGATGRAEDGTQQADVGWSARRLTIDTRFITDDDLPAFLAIAHYMFRNRVEGFIDLYPGDDSAKGHEHRFPCRLVEAPEFNPHFVGLHGATFVFEET